MGSSNLYNVMGDKDKLQKMLADLSFLEVESNFSLTDINVVVPNASYEDKLVEYCEENELECSLV